MDFCWKNSRNPLLDCSFNSGAKGIPLLLLVGLVVMCWTLLSRGLVPVIHGDGNIPCEYAERDPDRTNFFPAHPSHYDRLPMLPVHQRYPLQIRALNSHTDEAPCCTAQWPAPTFLEP